MTRNPLSDPMIEEVSKFFLAMADASRLKILPRASSSRGCRA